MKKLLLSACIALGALAAQAGEYTIVFKNGADNNQAAIKTTSETSYYVESGAEYIASVSSATNASPGLNGLKIGTNKGAGSIELSLATAAAVTPTKMVVEASASKNATYQKLTINGNAVEFESTNTGTNYATFTFDSFSQDLSTLKFEKTNASSTSSEQGFIFIHSVTVTYNDGVVAAVEAPVVKMVEGEYSYSVEMTCETEGAEIRYTTDGTAPTAESTLYTAPVEVYEETVFKAIAVKGSDLSKVTTFTAKPAYILGGFGDLLGFEPPTAGVPVVVKCPMTALYQSGAYLYVNAGYNNMLIYGSQPAYAAGTQFNRIAGTYVLYNGQPEIKDATLTVVEGESQTVNPQFVELDMISTNMVCAYVELEGIEIRDINGKAATLAATIDGDEYTLALYNQFGLTLEEGQGFNIIGFVGINKGTVQLQPVSITGGQVMEQVAAPVITPNGGELNAGDLITITCATESAKIYYTTDGTAPTAESTLYTEAIAFAEAMTVKAIAVAEGMLDSDVASASFTIYDPNKPAEGEYTFDFTDISNFGYTNADATEDASVEGNLIINVSDKEFKGDVVSLINSGTGTAARLYYVANKSAWGFRTYKNTTTTVSVPTGYVLTGMTFNGSLSPLAADGVFTNGTYDKDNATWTPDNESTSAVEIKVGSTLTLNTLKVAYKNTSAVKAVEAEGAEAVYYNLQGVRVENPTAGLYIRVAGQQVTKVLVK